MYFQFVYCKNILLIFIILCDKVTDCASKNGYTNIRKQNYNLKEMYIMKYVCDVCGWEYDPEVGVPEAGIEPGVKFEDLPDDFVCPLCGVGKDNFSEQ